MWSVNGTWIGGGAGHLNLRRIQLKAAPAEDHLVAHRRGDLHELLAQAHRAAADGDVLGRRSRRTHMAGQRGLELYAAVVGVAVDQVGGAFDGGADAGQRAEHRLVAGKFDGARHGLAGNVNRQPGQRGPQAGGHFDSICCGCVRYASGGCGLPGRVTFEGHGGVPERPNGTHC